ncbi:MAG TPA: hypothetical protein VFQ30_11105 [Ktedonobacteraceae bacterium]|nr:hypothetical protein [Ktedonobacteraceae bacterium]
MDPTLNAQIAPYKPWLIIAGVVILFLFLRLTRKGLRQHVDQIGYFLFRERGLLIWFWMNSPGVILHELSHAFIVLLLRPFGFRITSIALFRIKPMVQRLPDGRVVKSAGRKQSLQLGEVQYVRPQGRIMSNIGDGLSAIAPLFGGIGMFILLYWVATGYNLWEYNLLDNHFQLLRPGWPWWTLLFAPYLILTVTSELWPSRQDWKGARWLVFVLLGLTIIVLLTLWYFKLLVFNKTLLLNIAAIATHIDFALGILLALDLAFLLIAYCLLRAIRR